MDKDKRVIAGGGGEGSEEQEGERDGGGEGEMMRQVKEDMKEREGKEEEKGVMQLGEWRPRRQQQ